MIRKSVYFFVTARLEECCSIATKDCARPSASMARAVESIAPAKHRSVA